MEGHIRYTVQDGEASLARLVGTGSGPVVLKITGASAEGVWYQGWRENQGPLEKKWWRWLKRNMRDTTGIT